MGEKKKEEVEKKSGTEILSGKARWGGDERKRPEQRTQVSNHLPMSQAEKVQQSYSSKRQGQHWWSELFVFLLTSFIPNEMCNQSDVVLQKHFTPSPHQHPQTHNWFPNTMRQNENPYSIIFAQKKKKRRLSYKMRHKKQRNIHRLLNHTLMSIICIQNDKVCNWHRTTAKDTNIKKKIKLTSEMI